MPLLLSRQWATRSLTTIALALAMIIGQGLASAAAISDSSSSPYLSSSFNERLRGRLADGTIELHPASSSNTNEGWFGDWGSNYSLDDLSPVCDDTTGRNVYAFVGYDTWRSIVDGNWQNNGIHTGLNYGTPLGAFSDWTGVGFQIGASVGAYNWSGNDYRISHLDQAQPQGFVTYGLFRRANESSRWSAGVVQDWMLNSNYGLFAQNPTISQWRGQAAYATSARNEYGIWGTWRAMGDARVVPGFGQVSWRSVNQISAFWHYKWAPGGADTYVWVGLPENDRLTGGGSLGDYLIGLLANVPLSDRFALYALVTYMHPSAAPGPLGAKEDSWNFSIGLSFYPARNARSSTVAGRCWMPLLPVANNGYFLVDQSQVY